MSTTAQKKDWWELFTYMSKSKSKQRHTEAVNTYPANDKNQFYIQVYGTEFVQLSFQEDIGERLIERVAKWARDRRHIKKLTMGAHDNDVIELKHLLLGRASQFVEYCSTSDHPDAEDALWGIFDVHDIHWPKSSFTAPVFYDIWGWIQLELKKEGEFQMPGTQSCERQLREYCRVFHLTIIKIEYDSQRNVRYLVKEDNNEA